jgi:hypothetical protein
MSDYPLIFLAGLAGSWHCIGMCGGFACALGAGRCGRTAALGRQLAYNAGRVTTYGFLGALMGFLLADLCVSAPGTPPTAGTQQILALVSGGLMLLIGLQFLGWLRLGPIAAPVPSSLPLLVPALRALRQTPGAPAALALGVANGFLPCPLVYAFVAQAAGSGGPLPGLLIMLAFGLGTFPAMLAAGGLGRWLAGGMSDDDPARLRARLLARLAWRQRATVLAGGLILLLGALTVARGLLPLDGHLHGS